MTSTGRERKSFLKSHLHPEEIDHRGMDHSYQSHYYPEQHRVSLDLLRSKGDHLAQDLHYTDHFWMVANKLVSGLPFKKSLIKELSQIIKQNKVGKQQERNIEENHVNSSPMRTTYSLITVLKSRATTKVFLLVAHIQEATERERPSQAEETA